MGPHKNNHNCVVHNSELISNQIKNKGCCNTRLKILLICFRSPDHHINAVRNGKVANMRQAKVCSLSKGCKKDGNTYSTPKTTEDKTDNTMPLNIVKLLFHSLAL